MVKAGLSIQVWSDILDFSLTWLQFCCTPVWDGGALHWFGVGKPLSQSATENLCSLCAVSGTSGWTVDYSQTAACTGKLHFGRQRSGFLSKGPSTAGPMGISLYFSPTENSGQNQVFLENAQNFPHFLLDRPVN